MNGVFDAAVEICGFLSDHDWRYCVIGGLAVQVWGEPRTTLDADITLLTGLGEEERFAVPILDRFESRISNGLDFALRNRVLLLKASNGKDVDVTFGALPFETRMIERAITVDFSPDHRLPCCTPEDLIVTKLFASRPRDLLDAASIVIRQERLDNEYILDQLAELGELKGSMDILEKGRELLEEGQ